MSADQNRYGGPFVAADAAAVASDQRARPASRWSGWSAAATSRMAAVGVIGILGVSAVTVLDVLLRWLFNSPIHGLNEITSLLLALGVAACIPAGLSGRVNISIDFIQNVVPGPAMAWLRVLGAALMLLFVSLLVWRLFAVSLRLIGQGQTTAILGLPIGQLLFGITAVLALGVPAQAVVLLGSLADAVRANRRLAVGIGAGFAAIALLAWLLAPQVGALLAPIGGMQPAYLALIFFALLWVGILLSVPLGAAMGLAGLLGAMALLGADPGLSMFGNQVRGMLVNDSLAVLPLFLLMGAFATVAGLSADIFTLAHSAIGHWRGGLAHATIAGSAGFGALTGSSLATSATIGKVALPEMAKRGYALPLAAGTVAAGGTLGQLIPPSTVIVIYALLTEESIGTLFIATIVPALLTALLYLVALSIVVRLRPEMAPPGKRGPLRDIAANALRSWGAFVLIGLVIGGLYTGVFTETEAASVGAFGAFLFALMRRKITRHTIWDVMKETTSTIALVYVLIFGAVMFSFLIGITGIPSFFLDLVTSITAQPLLIVLIIALIYIALGTVMDSFAIMIITVPVFAPLIVQLGYDPIWWGIVTVCLVELGMITPPFGLNLFILNAIDKNIKLTDVYRGVLPFVGSDIVKIILIILFPAIVLWLPGTR